MADFDACVFYTRVANADEVKKTLDPKNALATGCRVAKHPDCCVLCAANNDCMRVPLHFNCFPAETVVSACHVKRAYRRWYRGDFVEIVTARGDALRGTPNHPVLTNRGWVALGELDEGDYVVRDALDQGVGVLDPDVQNVPTTIGQVFDSLADLGHSSRAMGRDEQFHGDGTDGDVDVVTVDGELLPCGHPAPLQPVDELLLAAPDLPSLALTGDGASPARFGSFGLAPPRRAGGGAPGGVLLGGPVGSHQPVGIARSPVVGECTEELGECRAAGAADLGEGVDRLAGAVALDQVVRVRRFPFSGHVYNLETQAGWYLANNILARNCRCKPEGYLMIAE